MALASYLKAASLQNADVSYLNYTYTNLSNIYVQLNDIENANFYFDKLKQFADK